MLCHVFPPWSTDFSHKWPESNRSIPLTAATSNSVKQNKIFSLYIACSQILITVPESRLWHHHLCLPTLIIYLSVDGHLGCFHLLSLWMKALVRVSTMVSTIVDLNLFHKNQRMSAQRIDHWHLEGRILIVLPGSWAPCNSCSKNEHSQVPWAAVGEV